MQEEHNVEIIQHNLKSRDTIRPPSRYASQDQLQNHTTVNNIKILIKRKRSDKKGLITKINQIESLIEEKGSQAKIKFVHETLMYSKRAAKIQEELMELLEEDDENFGN